MTKEEIYQHNKKIITKAMIALVDKGLADPIRLVTDTDYASEMVNTYQKAANITREILHMPKLYLIQAID